MLVVRPGEVRLEIEASPITPGAPLLPEQLLRVLEEGHRLALAVDRAGSSDASSGGEASAGAAPERFEIHTRPKETGRIVLLAALFMLLGFVVLVTIAPGILSGSGGRMVPAAPDPPPARHH